MSETMEFGVSIRSDGNQYYDGWVMVEYTYYPGRAQTYWDPMEPDEVEIERFKFDSEQFMLSHDERPVQGKRWQIDNGPKHNILWDRWDDDVHVTQVLEERLMERVFDEPY